jgi:PAS domain S-box-containing protein
LGQALPARAEFRFWKGHTFSLGENTTRGVKNMMHIISSALISLATATGLALLWRARNAEIAQGGDGWRYLILGFATFLLGEIVGLVLVSVSIQESLPNSIRGIFIALSPIAIVVGLLLVAIGLYKWLSAAQALLSESNTVKKSNTDLRKRVSKDETLLSMIPAVFYGATVFRSGKSPKVIFENTKIEEILGYRMEEYEANPHLFASLIHEEDRPHYASDGNEFWYGKEFIEEKRFQHKNGEYRWLRRYLKTFRIEDDDVIFNCYGCLFDITDLKQAEVR